MVTSQAGFPLKIQFGSAKVCFMVGAILSFWLVLKQEEEKTDVSCDWSVSVACRSSCPLAGKPVTKQLYEHFILILEQNYQCGRCIDAF